MRIKNRHGRRFLVWAFSFVIAATMLASWLIYPRLVGPDRACRRSVEKLAGRPATVAAPGWEAGQFWEMAIVRKDQAGVRRFTNRVFVLGARQIRGREAYVLSSLAFGEDGCPTQSEIVLVSTSDFAIFRPDQDDGSTLLAETVIWDFPLSVGKVYAIGWLAERKLMARVQRSAVVETPAGRFEAFQILREGNPDMLYWYAPQVRADVRFENGDANIKAELEDYGFVRPDTAVESVYDFLGYGVRSQDRNFRYLAVDPLEDLAAYDIERGKAEDLLEMLIRDSDTAIRESARLAVDRLSRR